jgi:hypothetical protein
MQIHSLILYGHNGLRRELKFNLNGVSIIAGDSATGKSSLIEIIDYCFGSGECRVPDGVIRENVAWYALRLATESAGQLFVARRGPLSGQKSTHQFVILNGRDIPVPELGKDDSTHNLKDAVKALSEYLGIRPNETSTTKDDETNYDITVRHAIKFCLQYQDEIASKRALFHQQSEGFKAKGIYDSLPYLLGFQQDDYLDRLARLKVAKKELAEAARRLDEYESLAAGGLDVGNALIAEAAQVAITSSSDAASTPERLLQLLETVLEWSPEVVPVANSSDDVLTSSQQALVAYERQRQETKGQLLAAESTTRVVTETETEWTEQVARLQSAKLFPQGQMGELRCPLCEQATGQSEASLPQFRMVVQQFESTSEQLNVLSSHLPNINSYVANLRDQLQQLDSNIVATRQRIRQLLRARGERVAAHDLAIRQAMTVGKIRQYLDSMRGRLSEGKILRMARESAQRKVDELEQGIRNDDIRRRLRSIADQLQAVMTEWAEQLKLEFASEPFRINFDELTVEVSRTGYQLPLYRMGSGKNWLGCHLIAHFALHSYFVQKRRPVPRFLILDQPTQVFYPPDDVDNADGDTTNLKPREVGGSEDRDIVERMFKWLFERSTALNEKAGFQLIVTDHAELRTDQFKAAQVDLPRWREGVNSLVPPDWLS